VGACVGETFCSSLNFADEDACRLAAEICQSLWLKRDDETVIDDLFWEMSERRIDELASDPEKARAYLAERSLDL
jgi:hypothetical protein